MKNLFFFFIFLVLPQNLRAETRSVPAWMANRQAEALLKEGKFQDTIDVLSEALTNDPSADALHLNLGLAFEGAGMLNQALASYTMADRAASNRDVKFMALFNRAQLLAKDKKIDQALGDYQQALTIQPNSQEVKTNIELLMQQQQQQQKGGGEGNDPKNQEDKDQKGKNQEQPKEFAENKPQPKKYKPENLSEGDVKKILEELKNQEKKIRGDFEKQGQGKEKDRDKDW